MSVLTKIEVQICVCVRVRVRVRVRVGLKMTMCQGAEESDTHVLSRTRCVGSGCVWGRILPMSPSLSVSRSHYCSPLLPVATCFIYMCNADLCWRKWHSVRYGGLYAGWSFEGGIHNLH